MVPTKRSLFYLFGIIYNAVIITAGSIILSTFETGLWVLVGVSIILVNLVMNCGWTLLTLATMFGIHWIFPGIVPLIVSAMSPALPVVLLAVSIGLAIGFVLLVVSYRLVLDWLIGIPNSSLAFYSYELYEHGVIRALTSPFGYLIERVIAQIAPFGLEMYLGWRKAETHLISHIDTINETGKITKSFFLDGIAMIVCGYLYGELVRINNRLFPVWLEKMPAEGDPTSFMQRILRWAEDKYKSDNPMYRYDTDDRQKILFSHLESSGYIKRKLVLVDDKNSKQLESLNETPSEENETNATTYFFPVAYAEEKIIPDNKDGEKKTQLIQKFVLQYSDSPKRKIGLPEIEISATTLGADEKPQDRFFLSLPVFKKLEHSHDRWLKTLSSRGINTFYKPAPKEKPAAVSESSAKQFSL